MALIKSVKDDEERKRRQQAQANQTAQSAANKSAQMNSDAAKRNSAGVNKAPTQSAADVIKAAKEKAKTGTVTKTPKQYANSAQYVKKSNPVRQTFNYETLGTQERVDQVASWIVDPKEKQGFLDGWNAYTSNALTADALLTQMDNEFSNNKTMLTDHKGEVIEDRTIVSKITQLRDPYILLDDGTYYAYGTGWVCYMNTTGRLDGEWVSLGKVVSTPSDAINDYWAPEVYKYNGKYYMFTTYRSQTTGHRGCSVFCAEQPQGPFYEISDGHITPHDWDAIDGTLYIDEEDQPWMVFVHEWTCTEDGVGRMVAAKMSDDLKALISEPIELFRADDPSWSAFVVTDGCYMYHCESGELIMIWSNLDAHGYCVGIARSDNGRLDGNWTHDEELLYSKSMTRKYDGGHGMIFNSIGGQLYLAIHSPNNPDGDRMERPIFVAIREENGTLVWDQ